MSKAVSSVQRWPIQFDIGGLFYSSSLAKMFTLLSSKEWFWTAESLLKKLALWCCVIHSWRGCFVSPVNRQNCMNYNTLLMPWSEPGYNVFWGSSQVFQMFQETQGMKMLLGFPSPLCQLRIFLEFFTKTPLFFVGVQFYYSYLVGEILWVFD